MPGCTIVLGEIGQLAHNAAFGFAAICGNNAEISSKSAEVELNNEDENGYRSVASDTDRRSTASTPDDVAAPGQSEVIVRQDSFFAWKNAVRAYEGLRYTGGYAFFDDNDENGTQSGSNIIAGDSSVDNLSPVNGYPAEANPERKPTANDIGPVTAEFDDNSQFRDTATGNNIAESTYTPGGGLRLNAGYSSIEGVSVGGKITRTNIFGSNTELGASVGFSEVRTSFELGYSDGNIFGRKYAFAPTVFAERVSSKNFGKGLRLAPFRQSTRGFNILLNRKLNDGVSATFNYRWSKDSFRMMGKQATCDSTLFGSALCGTIGKTTGSIASFALTLDRKSHMAGGPRGFRLRLAQDVSAGGSASFLRSRLSGEALIGLGGSWNLSFDIEGGYIKRLGNNKIPLFDRFYIGDSRLRGFDLRGLGPKIRPSAAQAKETVGIGGRAYYVARTELSVAVGGMLGVNGVRPGIFIDAGSVFAADRSGLLAGEKLLGNSARPRISAGIGLAMDTAVGRLRIDFAKPIMKQPGDRRKLLSISFGAAI